MSGPGGRGSATDGKAPSVLVAIPGPPDDQSWSGAAASGARMALDGRVDYRIVESLNPELLGWSVVLGHGIQYAEFLADAAAQLPDTTFVVADDLGPMQRSDLPNISYVDWQWDQATYLGGVLATRLSETGKIGYIGGAPVLTQQRAFAAFVAGAAFGDANTAVIGCYAGTFLDVGRGKRLAEGLLGEGVDVICHTADICGIGAMDAVEQAGKLGIGFMNREEATRPAIAAFIESDVESAVVDVLERTSRGQHVPRVFKFGFLSGFLRFNTSSELVPPEVVDEVESLQGGIARGEVRLRE